jgi:hypothetical protein
MRIRRHLTFASVCSSLALTVALSTGTAYAASTIFSADIVDGEVKTPDLGDRWLTGDDLALGSVTGREVADNSLTGGDLAGGGRTTSIDAPAETVPRNWCREISLPVTGGALAGDVVVVSPGAPLQAGLVVAGARAVSSTQVRATLCNLSGTTQAQITDLPVRVLTLR